MADRYTLKVKEIVEETHDTKTIHFKQPLFKKVKYQPGQFVTLVLDIDGQQITRSYSMSSTPDLDSTVAVTVKRVEGGLVSNYLNERIKVGDAMQVIPPNGRFTLTPDKKQQRHIVLIGAGSGITPLMSILKAVLFFEPESTVSLIYGNRNERSVIFKQKITELKEKFGERLNVVYVYSQPEEPWHGHKGRIDEVMCMNILNLLPKDSPKTEYFLCGPDGMMDCAKAALKKLKVGSDRVHSESFVAPQNEGMAEEDLQTRTVKIHLDGEEHELVVNPDQSILEAGLDEGLDMPFSCQSGLCTACMGRKVSGEVKMMDSDTLSADEIAKGYVLTCVGHPLTDDVEIDFE